MNPRLDDYALPLGAAIPERQAQANAAQPDPMQEVQAIRADLRKIERVAREHIAVSMAELKRTLLAANVTRPRVNSGRVLAVGTAMRAR